MPTIEIADKQTLDSVDNKIDTLTTNLNTVDTVCDNIYSKVDAEVANILTDIGATNATGGSTTAGTVMGKLNKLISDVASFVSNWTSTRAGYIDNIRSYTVTNNTASKTGVLSAKLAYVISLLENTTYGLSAIKNSLASSGNWYAAPGTDHTFNGTVTVTGFNKVSSITTDVGEFIIPSNGSYTLTINATYKSIYTSETTQTSRVYIYNIFNDVNNLYSEKSVTMQPNGQTSVSHTFTFPGIEGHTYRVRIYCTGSSSYFEGRLDSIIVNYKKVPK